ncbi:agouti-related protein isoform X1 [Antennarius striatus]|uniref:agouti-related protein isoform X1 n=1 Tax=Antennarius striatus TaxID=241820 RepID=UPI0035AEFD5F
MRGDRAESQSDRMFASLLLCYWSFNLLRLSSPLVHGNLQVDEGPDPGRHADTSFLSAIERSHAPEPLRDPALLPLDVMEDRILVDLGSYDEVGEASFFLCCFWFTSCGVMSPRRPAGLGAAPGPRHALAAPLHPAPAVVSGLPAALLRRLRHLLLPLLQRHLLLPPRRPRLPGQTRLTTPMTTPDHTYDHAPDDSDDS